MLYIEIKWNDYNEITVCLYNFLLIFSQADQKKEEGNQLYKTKNYREALQRYSEAIGKLMAIMSLLQ